MSYQQSDILEIQPLIEQIFPNLREVPVNSISSSIFGTGEQKKIYLLIVGDDRLINPFLADTQDEAKSKIVTIAEKCQNKINFDLIMEFNFYFRRGGKGTFKVMFQAAHPEMQKQYVQALKEIENLCFIIADQERNIRKVFEVDWYYYKNKKVIEKIVTANGY
ncbi:MAG: hypothetical protein GX434_13640 [Peptococcaceae bacterium]|nr:hypothetical protein [Peptococcaceae bacterium]